MMQQDVWARIEEVTLHLELKASRPPLLMWSNLGGSSSGLAPLGAQWSASSNATSRRVLDLSSGRLDLVSVSNVTLSNVVMSPED
jgi:hypothetical protein